MARVREHINGLDLTNVIAAFTKDGGVTGKRGRSAGNVDDAFGTHGKDGVKNGPLTAGSWRIKDNDVGADSVPHKKGQLFSRISTDEFTVFDASAIAGATISIPKACRAFWARKRVIVPVPQ